ncbi:MAG: hypothetical protein MR690_05110 [Rikenellaceae bacterium]|nr:hypothetical protein [Rikenellaceae bacterium]MDY4562951.1 hypothetical protein [Candidatus Cryptobacteroides sp.]
MKNYILLASAAMMVATVSCTMDLTPKGEAPASNEITFDAADLTDIRPGEVITATMVIPTGGKNIMSEERGWKVDSDVIFSAPYDYTESIIGGSFPVLTVKEEGGKSILRFYCAGAGEHTVTYYTRYNWKGLTDGSTYKDVEVRKTITASEDIYGSKWGDSEERTKGIHTYIIKNESKENVYHGEVTDPLGSLNLLRVFTFDNGKLAKIEEYFSTTKESEALYAQFLKWHKAVQEKQNFTYDASNSTRNNEAGKVVVADRNSEEAKAENAALLSGQLDVHTVYHKEGTDAAIDLWMTTDKDGKKTFNFSRTYTPSK